MNKALIAALALALVLTISSGKAGASSKSQSSKLFKAFWQVAGREESRNQPADWRANDGSGPSIGWMHFNQAHSIHLLMREAYKADPAKFKAAFNDQWQNFANEAWVKKANLNDWLYKGLLLNWLKSSWGIQIQGVVAKKYYFDPTMAMIDRIRPSADDVYRVVVASARINMAMSKVEALVRAHDTAEAFTNYLLQRDTGKIIWHRWGRTLKNARSMLSHNNLAIT